ncbi:AAA family ATPase [Pseudoduganella sp. UC29_106]|uniref:AAA family ATPase n=1 Tax=Pseudoduganella sp. UC29_106 TaxID=3374553 RepID=UPI003756B73D
MYTQFFQLKQSPFSIAPDPRYLFMSERHREALAHLLYGVGSGGGFVLLTGEIGAGKTTVCRCFMEQIPENCRLAYIFDPKLTVEELLQSVCDEFRIDVGAGGPLSVKGYVDAINAYLLASHAQGLNNVLIIDEAQNLSAEVLEQLRLLTNLETSERKLLQIILIGQPELRGMLARPELEQLAQRVIARYHLGSLSEAEVGAYVEHRLAVAGSSAVAPFPRSLMSQLHQLTKGVPRRINLLCDRALLGAYVENQHQVSRKILRRAAEEVFAGEGRVASAGVLAGAAGMGRGPWPYVAAGVLAGVVLTGAAAWQLMPGSPSRPATIASSPAVARDVAATVNARAASSATPTGPAAAPASVAGAVATTASADRFEDAVRTLASQWGVQLSDGEGCAEAARQNLRCLQTKGGLDEIRLLDRPVLIKLRDDPVRPGYALLTALEANSATLFVGGKRETLSTEALEARFDGGFLTFWRAPRAWRDEVSQGDRGPDVDWLARRLAQLRGAKKPLDNQPLDDGTLRALREFQSSQRLKADGVAGPKTFIRLNQLGGVQEPRLRAQATAAANSTAAVVAGK